MIPPALKQRMPAAHRVARDLVFRHIPRAVMFLRSLCWRASSIRPALVSAVRRSEGTGGKRRSVLFLHHSYYHFYYLAKALRRRGWDAVTVNLEMSGGAARQLLSWGGREFIFSPVFAIHVQPGRIL